MSLNNYSNNIKIYTNDKYNLKCFFLNKNLNIKKNYNFFFKSINNYNFMNKFFTNFSLFNYYLYLLKKDYIYINILNINIGSVKILTYQYIYPSWIKLSIAGNLLKIKKNIFNTKLVISNYIDNFYIKRYFFLFSKLFIFVFNQEFKKLNTKIKVIKKQNFLKKQNLVLFLNQLKNSKFYFFKKFCLFFQKKQTLFWKNVFVKKFKNNTYWIKKYPFKLLNKKLYYVYIKTNLIF